MSAYGPTPARQGPILASKLFPLASTPNRATTVDPLLAAEAAQLPRFLSIHHLSSSIVPSALTDYLYVQFQEELSRGTTYPQEYPISRTAFDSYFLANDFFVGIIEPSPAQGSVELARGDREWHQCVGGAYYVKPNYPGRSSHICNAGFLVIPRFRSIGVATALAKSFVEYAPRLGYKASVFNLVYVNNTASVRIWDQLGFKKVGLIPGAGRLKRRPEDGGGEEYVDAWVVYRSFEEDDANVVTFPS